MARRRALTLVELLVVLAIIALLVSLVAGGLARARGLARRVVCGAHMHDLATAYTIYGNDFNDWLPGSPGTTGLELSGFDSITGYAVDTPGGLVQNWDWQSPLARHVMRESGLDGDNRAARWLELRRRPNFTCPSNSYSVLPVGGADSPRDELIEDPAIAEQRDHWREMPMNSYVASQAMLFFGCSNVEDPDDVRIPAHWRVKTPGSFAPRMTHIKRPGGKIVLSDGARINPYGMTGPFADVHYLSPDGGDFAAAGPPSSRSQAFVNPVTLDPEDDAQNDEYVYRHQSGSQAGLNALLFDGHVEWLSKIDAVVGVEYWYPTGTVVDRFEFMDGPNPKPYAWSVVQSTLEPTVDPQLLVQ
jgi:prepilin-type N-terminal cleavage/methylation domain-containing protein/prepilin-type processing-associated H-X9-DG protein